MHGPGVIAPSGAASFVVAAGRFFHAEALACPAGADADQRRQMAELAVEESAPLPPDQLVFGVAGAAERTVAWVAVKKRLWAELPAGVEQVDHLLPEPALPLPAAEPGSFAGWRWVSAAPGSLTAVRFADSQSLPDAMRGFAIGAGESLAACRERFASVLPGAHEPGVWRLAAVDFPASGGALFRWRHTGGSGDGDLRDSTLSPGALDLADVRDPVAVAVVRAGRRAQRRLARSVRALGYAVVAGLVVQAVIWTLGGVCRWQEGELADSQRAADRVEAESAMLATLDRVTAKRLPALERLSTLNRTRPDGVVLTSCAFAESTVKLAGRANSMNELSEWIGALRKDAAFTGVETTRVHTAASGTSFEIRLGAAAGGGK